MKFGAVAIASATLLGSGVSHAQSQEPDSALRMIARFIAWKPQVGGSAEVPRAPLNSEAKAGSDRDAVELRQVAVDVLSKKSARLREFLALLSTNDPALGYAPFEDLEEYRLPQDEDVYIYLLLRPGEGRNADRRRVRVARVLERYGDDKAFRAIRMIAQALTYRECGEATTFGEVGSFLAILSRHPTLESLRTIVRMLTPSEDTWMDSGNAFYFRLRVADIFIDPSVVGLWTPLLRSTKFVGAQKVGSDLLLKEMRRLQASGRGTPPP